MFSLVITFWTFLFLLVTAAQVVRDLVRTRLCCRTYDRSNCCQDIFHEVSCSPPCTPKSWPANHSPPLLCRPKPCRPRVCRPTSCLPESCLPTICRPSVCRPNSCQPDSCRSNISPPNDCRPNSCHPDSCRPSGCRPNARLPSACRPGSSRRNFSTRSPAVSSQSTDPRLRTSRCRKSTCLSPTCTCRRSSFANGDVCSNANSRPKHKSRNISPPYSGELQYERPCELNFWKNNNHRSNRGGSRVSFEDCLR